MLSDGVFGGVTSGPAPPPRGNRAGANEAGLLARGAVAGLPGIGSQWQGERQQYASYSGGAAPVLDRTSGWPRVRWSNWGGQFLGAIRPWQVPPRRLHT